MKTLLRENLFGLLALACALTVFLAVALEHPAPSPQRVATASR
jgi:predicted outer membrane lipoprotein